jgi:Na+/citrate or Na+/malate symporter
VAKSFVDEQGFLDFFVVTIVTGCILGMPKALLIKARPRFAVPIVGCLISTFLIVGAVGALFGYGFGNAILFLAAPIMVGGLGLGAIPMADMYAARTGGDPGDFLGNLIWAVVIANIVCILIAGIYSGLGKNRKQYFVGFNGFGQLIRVKGREQDFAAPEPCTGSQFRLIVQGVMIAGTLAILGTVIGELVPALHPYAWTILLAAAEGVRPAAHRAGAGHQPVGRHVEHRVRAGTPGRRLDDLHRHLRGAQVPLQPRLHPAHRSHRDHRNPSPPGSWAGS